ncbi:unnamed protein product [Gemmata massiliana]|uniref:Uncharacterized protein n=1 Tax=Gemmata massiliana TaxID=1210884 RepID=A0A6P2CTG4_9BACT|nr:hypothetical protein [Gemmata massiliana]VTR92193.1 unnamed protein product [Gemmata massiliana]
MPIAFDCACGRHFSVGDAFAGKRTKCPSCNAPLTVPVPETTPPEPSHAEDEAYRALLESPDPEPVTTDYSARTAPQTDEDGRPKNASPIGKPLSTKKAAKFTKPSAEERAERKERKRREGRPYDPERPRKVLYMIGGVLMIVGGGALCFFSINEGISIRGGVFGFMLAFGGVGTFFQGVTGDFSDDA